MEFNPYIENRHETTRKCNCGEDHFVKLVRGILHYDEGKNVVICVGMLEHQGERHVWISFITGEWPGTGEESCSVTIHVWNNNEGRIMEIKDGESSPFDKEEIFDSYRVKREEVLAVDGAKEWVINTYLKLFSVDNEINDYLWEEFA